MNIDAKLISFTQMNPPIVVDRRMSFIGILEGLCRQCFDFCVREASDVRDIVNGHLYTQEPPRFLL